MRPQVASPVWAIQSIREVSLFVLTGLARDQRSTQGSRSEARFIPDSLSQAFDTGIWVKNGERVQHLLNGGIQKKLQVRMLPTRI